MRTAKTPALRPSHIVSHTDRIVEQLSRERQEDSSGESLMRYLTTETTPHRTSAGRARSALNSTAKSYELEEKVKVLSCVLRQKEEELEELREVNERLRAKTRSTIEECAALTKSLEGLKTKAPTRETKKEIETYGSFVLSSIPQFPKLSELLSQRCSRCSLYADSLRSGDYPSALAISLKLISDWIVLERQLDGSDDSFLLAKEPSRVKTPILGGDSPSPRKDDYLQMITDSEKLLATISAHSDRINALNKQISDTMASSYQILSQKPSQSHQRRCSNPRS